MDSLIILTSDTWGCRIQSRNRIMESMWNNGIDAEVHAFDDWMLVPHTSDSIHERIHDIRFILPQ